MRFLRKPASLVFVAILVLALFAALASAPAAYARSSSTGSAASAGGSGPNLPFSAAARYFDPELRGATGRVGVLVAMESSAPTGAVAQYLNAPRAMPSVGDVRFLRGTIDASRIGDLQSSPYVVAVLKDRPIPFDAPKKPTVQSRLPASIAGLTYPQPASIQRESLTGGPEVTMRDVVNFTGARRAWTQLGVDGSGVTIAVVDTGVDFGTFNLGDRAVARDASGLPESFDPDGSTLAWTTIDVTSYTSGPDTFVTTGGTDPLIYIFDLFDFWSPSYGPKAFYWSQLWGGPTFFSDMKITGLPASQSGTYRFGVLYEWNFFIDLFPVLLIDTTTAGVYDTAYLDLSFDWWLNGFGGPSPDFSFSDEPALVPAGGNVVAARDMDGDGYPDISAGILSHGLDVWGLDPDPATAFTILKPLDDGGDYITVVYDWAGHGTSVAASAAGRESNHPLAGPGTGPGAKVMAVPIFAWFDVIEGWLWAAGFDLVGTTTPAYVPNYGGVYGEWTYTGNHKADIISNSWGTSEWLTNPYYNQWPYYDVLTVIEDALMTPGYADPAYPGTLMVHAGGNGAAGYGTVTEPGFSNLAITVGASTSLNHTSLAFAGFHNDVISWSARGPTALGAPKPDLLQVGAFAWAAAPVWSGGGNGFFAYTLFSGTSQATPVTSGSAAVAIEAYVQAHGSRPSPFVTKSILKSTATDLGYDPFVQGAGQIDVYNAAAYALGVAGTLTTTPATWDNVRPRIGDAWATASLYYGRQIGIDPPKSPIPDTSWFAGSVHPGDTASASFTIDAATGTVSGTISAVWHNRLSPTITISGTTGVIGAGWLEGYGSLSSLAPSAIPANADLMVVRGVMPYNYLDVNGDYSWDNRSRIVVGDWVDANGDGIITPNEVSVFNYGYNTGTTVEARVGLPFGRFAGRPLLWFSQVPSAGRSFVPMPFTVQVEFYERAPWSWITAPASFSATAGSPATWTASLAVPAGANPGVYEGQILITPATGNKTAVPVSVVVPRVIDGATLSAPLTAAGATQIYDVSSVNGYFDWRWRYESGDWKLWFVDVVDPNTVALRVDMSWTGAKTDVDLWSITPSGIPGDSSFSPTLGSDGGNNRRFVWSTRTGTTADFVQLDLRSGLDAPAPGLYTFAVHNVLLDGSVAPEPLTGTVSAVKITPRGPLTVVTQPGRTVPLLFTLSTGFDLNNVFFGAIPPPFSRFPETVEPGFAPLLAAGESLAMWANITVPATTAEGSYVNYLAVGANELPNNPPVLVRVNVIVDSTGPGVSILAPSASAQLRGTASLQAAVSDANSVASVSFTAGSASGAMSRDPVTGLWTASWDTTGTADGLGTVTVTATDGAGNTAAASQSVIVDNTAPTASFSSPAANSWQRGTISVSFSATDANLKSATLTFGGTSVDVTGVSSYNVDTGALADGAQTLTLKAVDDAGNSRTASLTVNVDNTLPVVALLAPVSGSFVRGSVVASFAITEVNVGTATLTVGTGSPIDVAGKTTQSIDTTATADGTVSIVLAVADRAGNAASVSVSVTIDNTDPAVSISAPAANANLRGTSTITWTATDANLDQLWLIIDGEARDATGTTSYSWNTNTVGDGSHTILVRAIDKAGNEKEASVTVTTDNVAAATSNAQGAGFTNGLIIGLIVAAVVGLVLGFFLGRRRKPTASTMPRETETLRSTESRQGEEQL